MYIPYQKIGCHYKIVFFHSWSISSYKLVSKTLSVAPLKCSYCYIALSFPQTALKFSVYFLFSALINV